MEDFKESPDTSKGKLNIDNFDDVIGSVLDRDEEINKLHEQISYLLDEMSILKSRVDDLSGKSINILEITSPPTESMEEIKSSNINLVIEGVSTHLKLPDLISPSIQTITEIKDNPGKSDSPGETVVTSSETEPISYIKIYPVFNNNSHEDSSGSLCADGNNWVADFTVIIQEPTSDRGVGYVKMFDVKDIKHFNPTKVESCVSSMEGVFVVPSEAMQGFLQYTPPTSSTYPHVLKVTLKFSTRSI